jgi:hypothetical protein
MACAGSGEKGDRIAGTDRFRPRRGPPGEDTLHAGSPTHERPPPGYPAEPMALRSVGDRLTTQRFQIRRRTAGGSRRSPDLRSVAQLRRVRHLADEGTSGPSGVARYHSTPDRGSVYAGTAAAIEATPIDRSGQGAARRFVYTSVTPRCFSGTVRRRLPVAAKNAFRTAGAATQIVGSPTPPQNPPDGMMMDSTFGIWATRIES